ncbi:MAG: cyclic nucleotide-binding domain-containing protein [Deltaproteobacteria bacterium]|nr:cyclic nucleotide-binding domain-containing protein [Deltaproteobacteria bacterium]
MVFRGEIEWEFNESGQFQTTGKVLQLIRNHLAKNELQQAVELYESCAQSIGDDLIADFDTSSNNVQKALANLFFRARDYARAAACCQKMGEWEAAARAYEAANKLEQASECYVRAGQRDKAAAILQKAGAHEKAAAIYAESKDYLQAARASESAGDILGAARLYREGRDLREAVRVLARITPQQREFRRAVVALADVLVEMGRTDVALQRLTIALPRDRIADPDAAEVAYRLATLCQDLGRSRDAIHAFDMILHYDPRFRDVAARLEAAQKTIQAASSVVSTTQAMRAITSGDFAIPAASTATGRIPPAVTASGTRIPATVTGTGVLPGTRSVPPPKAPTMPPPAAVTDPTGSMAPAGRLEGYQLLKGLPIFEDLSLDDMRDFYHLCEHVRFNPGDVMIEQGQPGPGLFIVREGSLRITKVDREGREAEVARVPAGRYVGEMSLVDDSPTSARVVAAEPVKAFKIGKDVFQSYLFRNDLVALRVYRSFVKTIAERLREANARLIS